MKKIERITCLTAPPVEGQFYLVPTCLYEYMGHVAAWPVFLPRHEDEEFLNFKWHHYHIDPRFVSKRYWLTLDRRAEYNGQTVLEWLQASPLHILDTSTWRGDIGTVWRTDVSVPHPAIIWKRLKCQRSAIPYTHSDKVALTKLAPAFIGERCHKAKTGFICPHKRFPLGSVAVVDGVQTCPLHGLEIDAVTGVIIGPKQTPKLSAQYARSGRRIRFVGDPY